MSWEKRSQRWHQDIWLEQLEKEAALNWDGDGYAGGEKLRNVLEGK